MKQALITVFRHVFAAEQQAQAVKPAAHTVPAVLSFDALREVSGGDSGVIMSPRGTWAVEPPSPRGTW